MRRLLLLTSSTILIETTLFSALAPLLPQYAHALRLSKVGSGILVASYAVGTLAAAVPAGLFAAKYGPKRTVLLGLGLLGGASVLFGLVHSAWVLDAIRMTQGCGAAVSWTGALAWLIGVAPRDRRGECIGVAMGAAAGGAVIGPAVGSAAIAVGSGPVFGFVGATICFLAIMIGRAPEPPKLVPETRSFLAAMSNRKMLGGLWLLALSSVMFGVLGVLAPLRLSHLGLSGAAIGAVFLVAATLELFASVPLGRWSDRRGPSEPLAAVMIASGLVSGALPWVPGRWIFAIMVGLAAIIYAGFLSPGMALLADVAEEAGFGQEIGLALLNVSWALGYAVGSGAGGALASTAGDATPYLLLATASFLTLPLLASQATHKVSPTSSGFPHQEESGA